MGKKVLRLIKEGSLVINTVSEGTKPNLYRNFG